MRTNDSPYPSTSNIKLDEAQRLAQQILVIIVKKDRGDFILFLFAYHDLNDKVQFVSCQYPLPTQARSLEQFEPHMAVDPGSVRLNCILNLVI